MDKACWACGSFNDHSPPEVGKKVECDPADLAIGCRRYRDMVCDLVNQIQESCGCILNHHDVIEVCKEAGKW